MAIGTAGYTAALCVDALDAWGQGLPAHGEVIVTGASGGVGSVAVALLSQAGYRVAAATGRESSHAYLRELGATTVVERGTLSEKGRPLQAERWGGAVDTVGGETLASVLAQMKYGSAATACGLVGGLGMSGTILPHIMRNVALIGIDSVMAPIEKRQRAWSRLARDLDLSKLAAMSRTEPMSELARLSEEILAGNIQGRIVIDVTK